MGNGVVQALKQEYDIEDEWVSYEIHPETPPEGMLLSERFPGSSVTGMFDRLGEMGAPYGVKFEGQTRLSNSHLALAASEFAREQGHYHAFHEAVFRAYFTEGKDIGSLDTLRAIAAAVGLSADDMERALEDGRYEEKLAQSMEEGAAYGVNGTPTCIVNGRYKIVGAQPIASFRNALQQIEAQERAQSES